MKMLRSTATTTILAAAAGSALWCVPALASESATPPFRSADANAASSQRISPSPWWEALGDQELNRLVGQALKGSPDIAIAQARLEQAEARLGYTRASGMPVIGAEAVGVVAASSRDLAGKLLPGRKDAEVVSTGLTASWEPLTFGRSRLRQAGAKARREAAQAQVADAHVVLSAAVANAYLSYRIAEAAVAKAKADEARMSAIATLTSARYKAGTTGMDEMLAANTARDQARTGVALADAELVAARDQLSALVGAEPNTITIAPGQVPLPPADLTVSDIGQMVSRRPDIRAADRLVVAAGADKGLARADRMPRISLFGSLGVGSAGIDAPISPLSLLSLVIPRISLPVFDGGRIKSNIRASGAAEAEAQASYRKAVLEALRDCNTALARFGAQRVAFANALAAESTAAKSAELAQMRFSHGTGTRIDVERATMALARARHESLMARASMTSSYITVMKAIGAGWQ